ncbi:hypothetical protein R3Q06_18780 [Rhodococcus erythropolis]|nr:hypothetical protein [Rhodococcus erythropolis]MDV6275546.1 hypothetical protein [Rhodococcus erythropolis]
MHDTKTPGDEKAVMGQYLPDGQYTSKLAFEESGCAKWPVSTGEVGT